MPNCATECLIEYIAKPQARGQSCLKGLRPLLSGNAIQFTGEKLDAHASSARSGACGPCRSPRQRADGLSRPAHQDDRSAGCGERCRRRRPDRDAENGRQYGPAIRDHEPAGRVRADRCGAGRESRAGRLHDRRVQRQHHDHGAQPAVQNALGHPQGFRTGVARCDGGVGTGSPTTRPLTKPWPT